MPLKPCGCSFAAEAMRVFLCSAWHACTPFCRPLCIGHRTRRILTGGEQLAHRYARDPISCAARAAYKECSVRINMLIKREFRQKEVIRWARALPSASRLRLLRACTSIYFTEFQYRFRLSWSPRPCVCCKTWVKSTGNHNHATARHASGGSSSLLNLIIMIWHARGGDVVT